MKWVRTFLICLLGALCPLSPALAQVEGSSAPGAPPAGPSLTAETQAAVTLRGTILYDTNVARSSAAVALLRGIVKEDETYSPAIALNLQKSFGQISGYLQGSLGYDFHQHNTILNREDIDLDGGLNTKVDSCTAGVKGDYTRQQSDLQYLNLLTTKNTVTDTTADLNAQCGRRVGLAPFISVSQSWSNNSATQLFTSNYNALSASAGIAYRRPALGAITIFGQYDRTVFGNRLVPVGLNLFEDGYDVYTGGLRFDHSFGHMIDTTLVISQTSLKSHVPTGVNFSGFAYEADVAYHPTTKFDVRFAFYRRTNPSTRLDATYSIDQSYSLSADYQLNRLFKFSLGGSSLASSFQGPSLIPGIDISRERTRLGFASVSYDIGRNFSLILNVTHQEATANVVGFSYSSNQVGLTLSKAF